MTAAPVSSHLIRMAHQLVDSALPTAREYWRAKFFAATPDEAADPRPFAEVLSERLA